ncbi:MAG: hypothetical protein HeimC3_14840 [Candidatus Heimdallarchaeota archaeon LC_3]|nr:MAG: hypothetical protein HeimC3_14840 [Candidatus Heimdallarchaeota archaeon LC_3]
MSIVKLTKKEDLDQLVAKITLKIGKKITQQEILDVIIKFSAKNIDDLVNFLQNNHQISEKRVKEILTLVTDENYETKGTIDEDIYGSH